MPQVQLTLPTRAALALLFLLVAAVLPARAQQGEMWIGAMIGWNPTGLVSTTTDANVYTGTADCGTFTSGSTESWWSAGVVEWPHLFSATVGLRLRAGWGGTITTFETPAVDPIVLASGSDTLLLAEHSYRLEVGEHRFRIEPAFTFPLPWSITGSAGVSLDLFSTSFSALQRDRLNPGGDILFDSGRTERPMATAESYSAGTFGFGAMAGVSRRIPFGKVALEPSLDLTLAGGPISGHGGISVGLRLGLALLVDLSGGGTPPDTQKPPLLALETSRRDTARRDTAATSATIDRSINVAIDMHGEDASGAPSSEAIVMLNETVERVVDRSGDTVEHNSRTVTPPRLKLQPTIHAGAGVRRWHIDLLYEGRVVGRYADTGTVDNDEVRWRITEQEAARPATTLTALLVVEDSLGTSATAQATLPIRFVRHGRVLLRDSLRSILVATLYPPQNGGEELAERDLDALDDLTLHLSSGARVDVLLNSSENRVDGMRRARAVAEELRHLLRLRRAPMVQITAIDNRTLGGAPPEGILFSRSIAVRATLPDRGER